MSHEDGSGRQGRLPQDVRAAGEPVPGLDLSTFTGTVDDYARAHAKALADGQYADRVSACWGLVARGADSLGWARAGLASHQTERLEDALAVLIWIGATPADVGVLQSLGDSLPDGEAADLVAMAVDSIIGPEPGVECLPTSELLLDGEYERFTERIRFINAPFDSVTDNAVEWLSSLGGRSFVPLSGTLPELLDELEPWAMPARKAIIVRTDSDWTAVFDQSGNTGNYFHEVVGERLGVSRLDTSYAPHLVRNREIISYGSCAFSHTTSDGATRTVQASYQSRWNWNVHGEPLPFEDLTGYASPRIVDRLTLATLNSYCRALGIRRNDPEYYKHDALLVEEEHATWARGRTLTAEQWLQTNR